MLKIGNESVDVDELNGSHSMIIKICVENKKSRSWFELSSVLSVMQTSYMVFRVQYGMTHNLITHNSTKRADRLDGLYVVAIFRSS